jgi:hypothetical protein
LFGRGAAALLRGVAATLNLAACGDDDIPDPTGVPEQTRRVSLFYSTGRTLFEEFRVIDANLDVYATTLEELLAATPETNPDVAIVQPEAQVLSVTLGDDGVLVIDWSADVLDFEADDREKTLAWASVLRTFGQFDEVKKVKFTVEGKTEGTVDGKDIQAFWGHISLIGQPWDPLRASEEGSEEATGTAGESTPGASAGGGDAALDGGATGTTSGE